MKTISRKRAAAPTEHRAERQQSIVEAASRLFAELGYSGCDMDRIAARLKIAKGTIYLYFRSKEQLFFACVDLGMSLMQQAVREAAATAEDPFDRIARAMRAYLDFFADHPHFVELLLQERAIFKDRKQPTYFEYREAMRQDWRGFYRQLIDEGRLRPDLHVDSILDTIGNLVYGTMVANHFLGRAKLRDEQREGMLDIILRGLLSDAERGERTRGKKRSAE